MAPTVAVVLAAIVACGVGCDSLRSFDTGPGEAYCGQITLGSGYRAGLSPRVQMRLTFDSGKLADGASPGRVSTYDAGADEGRERLLDEAELRPIAALRHDPLSQIDLGDGREQNDVFAVTPATAGAESLLAIVSLRSDETVEVRLLRPGAGEGAPPGREQVFGLFTLARKTGDCGF